MNQTVAGGKSSKATAWNTLFFSEIWIFLSAWYCLSGWGLSLLGCLNGKGYLVSSVLGAALLAGLLACRYDFQATPVCRFLQGGRWRKPLPRLFLVCALLAFIGGALYAPNNFDSLTYRFPRVLHWLAAGKWHWIQTKNIRMNVYSPGMEWLTAVLFVFSHGDRLFFLLNFIPYLLLPGLLFSSFRQLGVKPQVSWQWMWIIPCGYCYVLQAGSVANDSIGTSYCLAAIVFAARAVRRQNMGDFCIAVLGSALLVGLKGTNLPLLLPLLIVFLPSLQLVRRHPALAGLVLLLAVSVSFLPQAVLNHLNAGIWTGDMHDELQIKLGSPVYGLIGNVIILLVMNVAPPVAPFAGLWNRACAHWMSLGFFHELLKQYPRFTMTFSELQNEEGAGMGLGFAILLFLVCLQYLFFRKRKDACPCCLQSRGFWVGCGAIFGLLYLCAKLGAPCSARYAAVYYPLMLIPFILGPGNSALVRTKFWKLAAMLCAASGIITVILTPSRPLLPITTVAHYLQKRYPNNLLIQRTEKVYSVYAHRADNLAILNKYIPANTRVIGFTATIDDTEISLWRPFGTRRVEDVTNPQQLKTTDGSPRILVISNYGLDEVFGKTEEEFVRDYHARILGSEKIMVKVTMGEEDWFVMQLAQD